MSNDPSSVCWTPFDRVIPGSDQLRAWPRPPKAPEVVLVPRQAMAGGWRDEGRTALETLSRLAGMTTWRVPDTGHATAGVLGLDDMAHALGFVRDPLNQSLALALASRTTAEWPRVQELAVPRLLRDLRASHNTRAMVAGARRFRARLVLHDAFHDLAGDRRPREPVVSAARIRMTERDYRALYRVTAGFIEAHAMAGAKKACKVLFG